MGELATAIRSGDRTALGRAITLVESTSSEHAEEAQELLAELLAGTGSAERIGISGVPGAGKSTFIDAFGTMLTGSGHRVAVLAVDPSSRRTGGSILGDKTRMHRLAVDPNAFIRPSPASGTLGGVARRTRETMVLVEAAGYDVIIVETVGVGQNETVVADMVDFFLVLMLAGAGDELQGIKKGLLEVADMLVVNKADGDNELAAKQAARQYASALHLMAPASPNWSPPVITCSALHETGLDDIWAQIETHRRIMVESGEHEVRRQDQRLRWMWSLADGRVLDHLHTHPDVVALRDRVEADVRAGRCTAVQAATALLEAYGLAD